MYPVLWEPFGFPISSFGVLVALGFLAGGKVSEIYFREQKIDPDLAWRIVIYCMVGGVVGSKLWYAAEHVARGDDGSFISFFLSRAGMTWYGGLVGGALGGVIAARVVKLSLLTVTNAAATALLVGQFFGRIGCFLVGDDYGRRADLPWSVAFPQGAPPTIDPLTREVFAVHPTQLYEVAWLGAGALLLWSRRKRSPSLFAEYLMLAGTGRFWIEFFRTNPPLLGPLTNAQLVALACIAAGAAMWMVLRSRAASPSPG